MGKFLSGVAALALAFGGALQADPGGGKGNGGGGGKDHAAQAHNGGGKGSDGNGRSGGGKEKRAEAKSQGGAKAQGAAKPQREAKAQGGNGKGHGGERQRLAGSDREQRAEAKQARRNDGDARRAVKPERETERAGNGVQDRGPGKFARDEVRVRRDDRRDAEPAFARRTDVRDSHDRFAAERGLIDGCPPGLARKDNGCMPPGLARKTYPAFFHEPDWWGVDDLNDGRYSYYDGTLVRLGSGDQILGYLPLLGGALAPGNRWPDYYEPVALPDYYQDYYGLGPTSEYRYADDTLYNIDPQTSAITSVAALFTGDEFAVGEPLPAGYDIYNVPEDYRDQYADGEDAMYRYSDGYVYQVDPETQLIEAAIELLT